MALFTHNMPRYVIPLVAAWKPGAIAVAINPMLVAKDVDFILTDSEAVVLVCLDRLFAPT